MELTFARAGRDTWIAMIGTTRVYLDDESGAPAAAQVELARFLDDALVQISGRGAHYLDMFVDRARACGDADAPWWLDEVDLRRRVDEPHSYSLLFSLDGDDGGLWTVDMHVTGADHRPLRFERRQG